MFRRRGFLASVRAKTRLLMEKIFSKEVKIALVAIVAVVALFFGMNFLKGLSLFDDGASYNITFKNVKGLSKSTGVFADGYKVGHVSDIVYDYSAEGPIVVEVSLDPDLRIPAGSSAEITSDMMGNVKLNLLLANNPRERVEAGGTIKGTEAGELMARVAEMLPAIEAMVPKVDSILSSVNMLLSDPALAQVLRNTAQMTENLNTSTKQLNSLMTGLNSTMPGLMQHANATMQNAEVLTQNLSQVDIAETMSKVNRTLSNVEQMTNALNSNEGSLGLLMRDRTLYDRLNNTVADADSLMIDLKAHPKRYVHFSVFGKKDK